jgi:hypothetical protein
MPLPTIQPTDWPDWGSLPVLSSTTINNVAVASFGDIIAEINCGYYPHVIVNLSADGDGSSWCVALEWMNASTSEGGSIIATMITSHRAFTNLFLPMTCFGPVLRIVDNGSDTYPHNAIFNVTLHANARHLTGYPGGGAVIAGTVTYPALASTVVNGLELAPGYHQVSVTTTATVWSIATRTYYDGVNYIDQIVADQSTVVPFNAQWIAPGLPWDLVVNNGDAADQDFSILVIRQHT